MAPFHFDWVSLLSGVSTMGKASSPVSNSIMFLIGALLSREFDSRVLRGTSIVINWFSLGKNRSLGKRVLILTQILIYHV